MIKEIKPDSEIILDLEIHIQDLTNAACLKHKEITLLKARIARLEGAINTTYPTENCTYVGDYLNNLKVVANESTAQSLAIVQADAIESFAYQLEGADWRDDELSSFALDAINQLRDSVKGGK